MRLRELRIEASPSAADRAVVAPDLVFRWTAHHIRELFTACLPNAFVLDGSSVFQITCGPRGEDPQYRSVLGSSQYYVEDFDFDAYRNASARGREEMLLDLIEASLRDVAERAGADATVVAATLSRMRDLGCRLCTEVKKLGKRLPNGDRVIVLRCLSSAEGEAWRLRVVSRARSTLTEMPIGRIPDYLDRREEYSTATIVDGDYIIRTKLGREAFRCRLSA